MTESNRLIDLVQRLREVNWVCHTYGKTEIKHDTVCHEAADAIEAQAKRIAELEAALKPFADEADEYEGLGVQDKDQIFVPFAACRQARKVLGDKSD